MASIPELVLFPPRREVLTEKERKVVESGELSVTSPALDKFYLALFSNTHRPSPGVTMVDLSDALYLPQPRKDGAGIHLCPDSNDELHVNMPTGISPYAMQSVYASLWPMLMTTKTLLLYVNAETPQRINRRDVESIPGMLLGTELQAAYDKCFPRLKGFIMVGTFATSQQQWTGPDSNFFAILPI